MSRLPVVSSDGNTWGTVLNDFLSQAHNSDGSIKNYYVNVKDTAYGAKGDAKTVTDGAITSGLAVFTSATAVFTAADVGKKISVTGAGTAGAKLNTTISAYSNATTVTLAANAGTTVTGATTLYVTDDTAAVQAAMSASKNGDTIYFPGLFYVSSTIVVPGYRTLLGADSLQSGLAAIPGSNLDAVLCSSVWLSVAGSPTCDYPITIERFFVTGEGTSQVSGLGNGIVLMSYESTLFDVCITNSKNDGLLFTANCKNGTAIVNTMVENLIERVVVRASGGRGIHVADTTFHAATDGWIRDCTIDTTTQEGILIESAAGWVVEGTHLYAVAKTAINLGRPYSTRIVGNYIEPFGNSSTAASYYGIAFGDGVSTFIGFSGPNIASGNIIIIDPTIANASSFLGGINSNVSSSVSGSVMLSSNTIYATAVNALVYGITVSNQSSSSVTSVSLIGNLVTNITNVLAAFPTGGGMYINTEGTDTGAPVMIPSVTAAVIASSGTITTTLIGQARLAPTAAVTGIIMQAGTIAGQTCQVVNESAFTVTFAAAGTSHVADGVSAVIAANRKMDFTWDSGTSLWYHS